MDIEIFSKHILYDWAGANLALFKFINSLHANAYDALMIFISSIADHHNFPYYLFFLGVFAFCSYLYRKAAKQGGASHLFAAWVGVFAVLIAGYGVEGVVIHYAKNYFSYPRPYVELGSEVHKLETRPDDDGNHSFPSGHTAFITLMVVGLWPVLTRRLKWGGAFLIFAVMWSRSALGMHYPADTLASMLFMVPMVVLLRALIYRVLIRLFGLRC